MERSATTGDDVSRYELSKQTVSWVGDAYLYDRGENLPPNKSHSHLTPRRSRRRLASPPPLNVAAHTSHRLEQLQRVLMRYNALLPSEKVPWDARLKTFVNTTDNEVATVETAAPPRASVPHRLVHCLGFVPTKGQRRIRRWIPKRPSLPLGAQIPQNYKCDLTRTQPRTKQRSRSPGVSS